MDSILFHPSLAIGTDFMCAMVHRDMPYVENNSPVSGLSGLYYSIDNKC